MADRRARTLLSGTCAAAQDTAATWALGYADIAAFEIGDVDIGVAAFLSAHAACRGPSRLGRPQKVTLRDQSLVGGCGRRRGDTWLAASYRSLTQIVVPSQRRSEHA
jgi:hypothetical protein